MLQSSFILTYFIVLIVIITLAVIVFCIIYTIKRQRTNNYSCFIAGSTCLSSERDAIRAVISEINNQRKKCSISAYTFEDFPTTVVTDGPQEKFYNKFLRASTDVAIFVIDGEIGKETLNEFDVAFQAYIQSGKPTICTYCKENGTTHKQTEEFKKRLKEINHYWTPYNNLSELKFKFKDALISILDSNIGEVSSFGEKSQNKLLTFLLPIVIIAIAFPITCLIRSNSIDVITDKTDDVVIADVDGSLLNQTDDSKEKKYISQELKVTDELITKGCLTINHNTPVKYHITSEDPSKFIIDWSKVETTLAPGDVIYPKYNSHIYLHAEDDKYLAERSVWFSFYDFVEYSIKQGNMDILQDMFFSLEESDASSYILNDTATDILTKYTAETLFRSIKKGYKITHIDFHTEPDIRSKNYPKIKLIKCSKTY